jgi:hypothetical protein
MKKATTITHLTDSLPPAGVRSKIGLLSIVSIFSFQTVKSDISRSIIGIIAGLIIIAIIG